MGDEPSSKELTETAIAAINAVERWQFSSPITQDKGAVYSLVLKEILAWHREEIRLWVIRSTSKAISPAKLNIGSMPGVSTHGLAISNAISGVSIWSGVMQRVRGLLARVGFNSTRGEKT